uniref:Uncharacterized protein n=1 Tax=Alexandrium monilatum TaxID=311494 RepID=A0A7S4PV71_9DINO
MGTSADIRFRLRRRAHTGAQATGQATSKPAGQPAAEPSAEGATPVVEEVIDYGGIHLHADGYPSGKMVTLVRDLFAGCRIVNGIGAGMAARTHANGPDCLFAQAISLAKGDQLGGVYLLPQRLPGDERGCSPDYSYVVEVCERGAAARADPDAGAGAASTAPSWPPEQGPYETRICMFRGPLPEAAEAEEDGQDEEERRPKVFTPEEYLSEYAGPSPGVAFDRETIDVGKRLMLQLQAAQLLVSLGLHEEASRVMRCRPGGAMQGPEPKVKAPRLA